MTVCVCVCRDKSVYTPREYIPLMVVIVTDKLSTDGLYYIIIVRVEPVQVLTACAARFNHVVMLIRSCLASQVQHVLCIP